VNEEKLKRRIKSRHLWPLFFPLKRRTVSFHEHLELCKFCFQPGNFHSALHMLLQKLVIGMVLLDNIVEVFHLPQFTALTGISQINEMLSEYDR